MDEQVTRVIRTMGGRQQCNRLTGCNLAQELGRLGPSASAAIQAVYRKTKGGAHGRIQLISAVSRTGDENAGNFLMDVLRSDRLPPARVEAAYGIARLGLKAHLQSLVDLADTLDPQRDQGVLLALGYALDRLGSALGRPMIEKHFVLPPPDSRRWDQLQPGIYAAGILRLTTLRPQLEILLKRSDPFTRRDAVTALGRMRDRAAVRPLIECLRDDMPSVRREALKALQQITGYRHKESYDEWMRWWNTNESKLEHIKASSG
jgi:HEAT repeat protein